jgi:hypothetical protein
MKKIGVLAILLVHAVPFEWPLANAFAAPIVDEKVVQAPATSEVGIRNAGQDSFAEIDAQAGVFSGLRLKVFRQPTEEASARSSIFLPVRKNLG